MNDGIATAEVSLESLRLYSKYGATRGSTFKGMSLNGEVEYGDDLWFANTAPSAEKNKSIRSINFDLSSLNRGLTTIMTAKGNSYSMDCVVRED